MTTEPNATSAGERKCPRCGTAFSCGFLAGQAACWCFELPRVMKVDNANREGCLCPDCLKSQIEAIQQASQPE